MFRKIFGGIKNYVVNTKETLTKYKKIASKEKEIKKKHRERAKLQRRKMLSKYISKAGVTMAPKRIREIIFKFCIVFNFIISVYLIYFFAVKGVNITYLVFLMSFVWILIFILLLIVIWLMFYLMLDFKIFKRNVGIEEVLPDFLQLTSANVRAGMAIDRALWYSVRPRFGVLAQEIEIVAKETVAGKDLNEALLEFTQKYDSDLLTRSVYLLIEGLNAGGEVGDLLNKISSNIRESRLMRKEMAASVMTYVIFISFATMTAAPVLFALSEQLLAIISSLMTNINMPTGSSMGGFSTAFSTIAIQASDFRIFAILMLLITSFFSASIVAIIRKGNIKAGARYIPTYMIVSITVFYLASAILSRFMAGLVVFG
jgi:Flp pilus assembly protein TadB